MPPPPKPQRVPEDEIRKRWAALSLDQRKAVACFDDAGLVTNVRNAVIALFQKQVMMQKLGMRPSTLGSPDLFLDSAVFKELIDLQWKVGYSDEYSDSLLMDPEEQEKSMTLQHSVLEQEKLFERLRLLLPDLLASRTGRNPLPRARWKQLVASEPGSIEKLERSIAELVEQLLWRIGSDSAYELREAEPDDTQNVAPAVVVGDAEDWMDDARSTPKTSKKSKKKSKKKKDADAMALETAIEDTSPPVDSWVDGLLPLDNNTINDQDDGCTSQTEEPLIQTSPNARPLACRDLPCTSALPTSNLCSTSTSTSSSVPFQFAVHPEKAMCDKASATCKTGSARGSRCLSASRRLSMEMSGRPRSSSRYSTGTTRQIATDVMKAEQLPEEAPQQTPDEEPQLLYQDTTIPSLPEMCEKLGDHRTKVVDHKASAQGSIAEAENRDQLVVERHYWPADCSAKLSSGLRQTSSKAHTTLAQDSGAVQEATNENTEGLQDRHKELDTLVVDHHYWGIAEQKPVLEWCLPTALMNGIWRRGRWARRQGGEGSTATPVVRVQNTFLDVAEEGSCNAAPRGARSLSPSMIRGSREDICR